MEKVKKSIHKVAYQKVFSAVSGDLKALFNACEINYPDQPNPLHIFPVDKSSHLLDCVRVYVNPGNPACDIAPHWVYISFGFSYLQGDRKGETSSAAGNKGYGFELTFRLKREPNQHIPPQWPAHLILDLSINVFESNRILFDGEDIFCEHPIYCDSKIQHLLVSQDSEFQIVNTPSGPVKFLQLVGVSVQELKAAENGNSSYVIEMMKSVKGAGGPWLITDMMRTKTIFELDPSLKVPVKFPKRQINYFNFTDLSTIFASMKEDVSSKKQE